MLVVTRIDRLERSLKDLQDIVYELKGRRVTLRAIEQPLDTGTAARRSSTCWGCSPSSRPICVESGSSRASRSPKRTASIAGGGRALMRPRSGGCASRRISVQPPSPAGSASGELPSSGRSGPIEALATLRSVDGSPRCPAAIRIGATEGSGASCAGRSASSCPPCGRREPIGDAKPIRKRP